MRLLTAYNHVGISPFSCVPGKADLYEAPSTSNALAHPRHRNAQQSTTSVALVSNSSQESTDQYHDCSTPAYQSSGQSRQTYFNTLQLELDKQLKRARELYQEEEFEYKRACRLNILHDSLLPALSREVLEERRHPDPSLPLFQSIQHVPIQHCSPLLEGPATPCVAQPEAKAHPQWLDSTGNVVSSPPDCVTPTPQGLDAILASPSVAVAQASGPLQSDHDTVLMGPLRVDTPTMQIKSLFNLPSSLIPGNFPPTPNTEQSTRTTYDLPTLGKVNASSCLAPAPDFLSPVRSSSLEVLRDAFMDEACQGLTSPLLSLPPAFTLDGPLAGLDLPDGYSLAEACLQSSFSLPADLYLPPEFASPAPHSTNLFNEFLPLSPMNGKFMFIRSPMKQSAKHNHFFPLDTRPTMKMEENFMGLLFNGMPQGPPVLEPDMDFTRSPIGSPASC